MLISQNIQIPVCCKASRLYFTLLVLCIQPGVVLYAQDKSDSTKALSPVNVTAEKKQNPFTAIVPVQLLNREALRQINAETIAGASKYFSGVLIKDYGGVGGLKTVRQKPRRTEYGIGVRWNNHCRCPGRADRFKQIFLNLRAKS